MRKFIRHPSDIPIDFLIKELSVKDRKYLNDISFGGLSFRSRAAVQVSGQPPWEALPFSKTDSIQILPTLPAR